MKRLFKILNSIEVEDRSEDQPVRMPFPGRKARKAERLTLASALILITFVASFASLLPAMVSGLYPSSDQFLPTNPTKDRPKTSLAPGTIEQGVRDTPFSSKVADSSIPPLLTRTPDRFLYRTSYGVYSFNMSRPYIFTLASRSGVDLTRGSWFLVNSSKSGFLSPGNATVTVATNSHFAVSYDVLYGNLTVGTMMLRADFYQNVKPKLTASFSEASAWNLGSFNIFWSTISVSSWFRTVSAHESSSLPNSNGNNSIPQRIPSSPTIPRLLSSSIEIGASSDSASWTDSLLIDWTDAPGGVLHVGPFSAGGIHPNGLTVVFPQNQTTIDPWQVGTSYNSQATAFSTQRKTFSYGGYYFVFYYDGQNIVYGTSLNGMTWSPGYTGSGQVKYGFDIFNIGSSVAMTWLDYNAGVGGDGVSVLRFQKGGILGGSISWDPIQNVTTLPQHYAWPPSIAIGSDGRYWVGGVWPDSNGANYLWIYNSTDAIHFPLSTHYATSNAGSRNESLQLVPMKNGKLMALSSNYYDTTIRWTIFNPITATGPAWGQAQTFNAYLPSNTNKWNLFSAAGTPDGMVHLLTTPGTTYWMYNDTSSLWNPPLQIDSSASDVYPSIGADSLGGLQVVVMSMGSLHYYFKPKSQSSWLGGWVVFANSANATWIGVSRESTTQVTVSWTTPSPYKILVGTIPLVSGIASSPPSQSWSRLGVTSMLTSAEYVAPGNGLLAVGYTDLSAPGRGALDLSIRRVYLQPFTMLNGGPFNYEASPYSDLGLGWQLNIPWVGQQYLHYSDAQMFPIVWQNYTFTSTATDAVKTSGFENHGSLDFVFQRIDDTSTSTWITSTTYKLTTKEGTLYNFNTAGLITSIVDRTGQNQLTFIQGNYAPYYTLHNTLTSIIDSIGRAANFTYTPDQSGKLASITYAGQTVNYGYSGNNLLSAADAPSRVIGYAYSAQNNWLITGVFYPTGGQTSYTYGTASFGTDAVNYYVTRQNVYDNNLAKSTSFSYQVTDGSITYTNLTQSDGVSVQGSTQYEFNARAASMTVTSLDSSGAQMKKVRYWNDANGRVVQQDVYNGNSNVKSFYIRNGYDQWGNQVYSRDALGHEAYNSFANSDSQYKFQGNGNYTISTDGRLFYDDFNVPYNFNNPSSYPWNVGFQPTTIASSLLTLQAVSSAQGTWQSNWVQARQNFGYPFYAEAQTSLGANPGQKTIASDFEVASPWLSWSNPSQIPDMIRLAIYDGPEYAVIKRVSGVETTVYDSGTVLGGSLSVAWKIILTDSNTLTVYLNRGEGFKQIVSTTTLGLYSGFTPSYSFLAFYNLNTVSYSGSFDYLGIYGSDAITVSGLQPGQRVSLYDSNDMLQSNATVASGQSSVSLNGTLMAYPYGYLKIYEQDGQTLQSISPTREVFGGTTFAYSPPFRSGGLYSQFKGSPVPSNWLASVFFDDSLPAGATLNSDWSVPGAYDPWILAAQPDAPAVSGLFSHVSLASNGVHQHYFLQTGSPLYGAIPSGDFHIQFVYIPSAAPPSEIMLQFPEIGFSNPGFEAGNFNSWYQQGMNILAYIKHSGNDAAGPIYNTITNQYSNFILYQNLPGLAVQPQLWYIYGNSTVDSAIVWYSDHTSSLTALPYVSSWTLMPLNYVPSKQIIQVEVFRSAPSNSNIVLDDFLPGTSIWDHRAYWGTNSIPWGTDGTVSRRYMGPLPAARDTWVELIVKSDDIGTNTKSLNGLSYALYNGAAYWDYSALGTYGVNTIQISGLRSGQKVELYDANWVLKASQSFLVSGTARIDLYSAGINAFPFTGYLKVYSVNGALEYISPLMKSIWGGDVYTYAQPVFTNAFDFSPIGGSIHGASLAQARYQNTTSIMESYAKYDLTADQLQLNQRYDSPSGLQWTTTSSTYDSYGNTLILTDPRGNTTYYNYAAKYMFAYLTNETRRDGLNRVTTLTGYDFATGNKLWWFDPRGYNTTYQYDALGRLTRANYPNNLGSTIYSYVDSGNYVDTTSANGWKTRQFYDQFGRFSITERFLGNMPYSNQTTSYNWQNEVSSTTDQLGNTTSYQYDYLGRLTLTTKPDGTAVHQRYIDIQSQVIATDEYSNNRCDVSDLLGRLVTVVEIATSSCTAVFLLGTYITRYSYDWAGNLRSITNAASQVTNYSYDNLNRLTSTSYPDGTFELFTYDNNNNLVKKIDRAGVKTLISYDALNRAKVITYCGNPITSTSYTYDNNGNVLSIQNENATISYTYDARNRVLAQRYQVNPSSRTITDLGCSGNGGSWTVQGGITEDYTVSYTYSGDVLSTITYPTVGTPTNIGVGYVYDSIGRILTVNQTGSSIIFARFSYLKTDRISNIQYGNGLIGNYTYDKLQRTRSITLRNGSTNLISLNYSYNSTGTVASVTGQVNSSSPNVNEQYSYDPLERLTNAAVTSQGGTNTVSYKYNNLGNRLRQTNNTLVTSYYNNAANNELSSLTTPSPGTNNTYSYDPDGNLKTMNVTSGATNRWAYTWNPAGQLMNITKNGVQQGRYSYDGEGRQTESVEAGSNTIFYAYYGTETLYKQIYGSYSIDYIYAQGLRIATVDSSTGHPISFSTIKYVHSDALGSVRLITTSSSSVYFADGYQPYGRDNGAPIGSNPEKFTGKLVSQATGLYYEYQRWYDPSVGRFISQDPLAGFLSDPSSLNAYTYASNNPTTQIDPTGLATTVTTGRTCPAIWQNFFGYFACTASNPTIGDFVDAGAAWDGIELCWEDCGTIISDLSGARTPTGENSGGSPRGSGSTSPPSVTSSASSTVRIAITDPVFSDTIPGRGGSLPNLIGNGRVGQTVWSLLDAGVNPEDISVEGTFRLSNGQLVRPDIAIYRNGELYQFVEVKGGYASGTRALGQLSNYAQLAEEQNVSLVYKLYNSGSMPFFNQLRLLHIPF